jgi:phosphodiesterase/alkaline phosphatase D-like protein
MNISKNAIIALLCVAVIAAGGLLIYKYNAAPVAPSDGTATTTPSGTEDTGGAPSGTSNAAVPIVTTSSDTFVSNSTALVTGKVTPRGAQTLYWYEYGKTTSLGARTPSQTIGSGFIAIPAPAYITGLSANTTYYYRLSASNGFGVVNGGTQNFTTNSNPPPTGNAPTIKSSNATDVSRTTANLNGQVNPNGAATSYWFEYGETNDLGAATALQGAGSGSAILAGSVSISNLKPLTKYYFRLNASNQFGTVNGSILSFTTSGPGAPGAAKVDTTAASNITSTGMRLNGQVNPNGASTRFWFEYGVDSLLGSVLGSTTKTDVAGSGTSNISVSTTVTGLSANTRYYYRIVGENSYGTVRGDIVTATTKK